MATMPESDNEGVMPSMCRAWIVRAFFERIGPIDEAQIKNHQPDKA